MWQSSTVPTPPRRRLAPPDAGLLQARGCASSGAARPRSGGVSDLSERTSRRDAVGPAFPVQSLTGRRRLSADDAVKTRLGGGGWGGVSELQGFSLLDGVIPPKEPDQTPVQSRDGSRRYWSDFTASRSVPLLAARPRFCAKVASKRCSPSTSATTATQQSARSIPPWLIVLYVRSHVHRPFALRHV